MCPGLVLGGWTHIEHHDLAPLQAGRELVTVDDLDAVAIAEVRAGQPFDAGDVIRGDVSQRRPQLADPIAGQPVEDARPVATGGHQSGASHGPQVMRRVGDALLDLARQCSSTDRSPWASTSTISARRPLASALATSANPSNSASLAARSPMDRIVNSRQPFVKRSNDYLTMATDGYRFNGMAAVTHATTVMPVAADAVFRTLTDIARLPEWNSAMTSVIEQPQRLEVGREWLVEFHALGQTWRSRSTIEEVDTAARRFAYRSGTDDGNPSYALWTWEVADDPRAVG